MANPANYWNSLKGAEMRRIRGAYAAHRAIKASGRKLMEEALAARWKKKPAKLELENGRTDASESI